MIFFFLNLDSKILIKPKESFCIQLRYVHGFIGLYDKFCFVFSVKMTTKVMVHARGNFEKNLQQYGIREKQDNERRGENLGDPAAKTDKKHRGGSSDHWDPRGVD